MVNSRIRDFLSENYYESPISSRNPVQPTVVALLICGMLSSSVAMATTYPIGLVRTRLQASGMPGIPIYEGNSCNMIISISIIMM